MNFDSSIVNAERGSDDKCVSCDKGAAPRLAAVILYPSLGCPLVLAPGQARASLVIGVRAADALRFMVDADSGVARAAHPYIDRHLRLCGIERKDTDTSEGTLFGDGRSYDKARAAVTTRWIGTFDAERVVTCSNAMAFSLSPAAMQFYGGFRGGKLFELDIDLRVAPFDQISSQAFRSFAWMVELTQAEKTSWPGTPAPRAAHYQDLLIYRFLASLQGRRGKLMDTPAPLHEFDVRSVGATRMDPPGSAAPQLQAWHPVIRATAPTLVLGHLSDVHVNVRHQALAKSPAALLEDAVGDDAGGLAQPYAGARVCNAFAHLKTLVEKIGASGQPDTALLLTGDLIDFNRNIDPARTGDTLGAQWKAFNILGNIHDAALYPRWQDDMLVFSLVRHAYTRLKLPVFMTTGNHEAYETPYGISPRVGPWGLSLGLMEVSRRSDTTLEAHRREIERASAYADFKANAGIAADHNLTVYEATLAYGPTYPQTYTGLNFEPANFDWFGALFNPLGDFVVGLGGKTGAADARQLIAALAWGAEENFQNLGEFARPGGVDRQGPMILPRAAASLSAPQKALLAHAQALKQESGAVLVVASHFTVFSYDQGRPLSEPGAGLTPADAPAGSLASRMGLGPYNTGTCERNLKWYFDTLVLGASASRVDWHLSGHSHRAGVYTAARAPGSHTRVDVRSARDPGLHRVQGHDGRTTHFVVSSCGGPIGYQNLDGELGGWTLRPPAGSVVDTDAGSVRQVASDRGTGRPRLCVALDYLHVMGTGEAPLHFEGAKYAPQRLGGLGAFARPLRVGLSTTLAALACLARIRVWVFEAGKDAAGDPVRKWHCLKPAYGKDALTFSPADQATLAICLKPPADARRRRTGEGYEVDRCAAQAFCEVVLRKPTIARDQPDWSEDMNIDDHWVFPLELGVMRIPAGVAGAYHLQDFMARPRGELGEVPDWKWLHRTWGEVATKTGNLYPDPKNVIRPPE